MHRDIARTLAALCAAAAFTALTGCSGNAPRSDGTARLAVSAAALAPGVAEVLVTVGPGGGPAFPSFTVNLSKGQDTWSGYITNIPAGPQRSFEVVANDASHNLLQSGSARADVVAGKAAVVVVNLGDPTPSNPFANRAPVVDYVSASASEVRPGGTVTLSISAHDPDVPPDTVSILWSAACGTFDDPTKTVVAWTAPAQDGRCQITAKASDNRGASVSVFLAIDVATTSGDVLVEVTGGANPSPVITRLVADVRYRSPVEGDLTVDASDPGGDPLTYVWTSSCPGVTFATPSASTSTFTSTDGTRSCVVTVTVSDGKGGQVIGDVTLPPSASFNIAPLITHTVQPTVDLADPRLAQAVQAGEAVMLAVEAMDPDGQNLTFTWTTNAGTLDGQVDGPVPSGAFAPHETTSPGKSVIVFHAGASLPADAKVTITVRDPGNEQATHDFNFKPATATGPCAGKADGTACDDGNPCTLTSTCQAGACVGGTSVVCDAPVACKLAGVCQTSGANAGTCTYADAPTGTACSDARACTSPDACAAGVCMPGPSTCATGEYCNTAGVCEPGTCTPACSGRTCGPDGCGGSCGTCATGTCNNATGVCVPPSTVTVPHPAAAKQIPGKQMNGLAMDAGASTFAAGQVGCTFDVNTNACAPVAFDTATIQPLGANDAFVVKYGPAPSYAVQWAIGLAGQGEPAQGFTQGATGVAALANGNVAVLGTTEAGLVSANGAINLPSAGNTVYLATLGPTGAGLWATQFQVGGGQVFNVASHQNRIAICGSADLATVFAPPGFTFVGGGGSVPNRDAILAVYDVSVAGVATLAWSKQLGGGADEYCAAVAFDDAGNLIVVGQYNWVSGQGLLDPGSGALPDPNGTPAVTPNINRRHLWVARYGPTGAIQAQGAFGNVGANGAVSPRTVAVDAGGNVAVGGGFTVTLPLAGQTSLVSAGNTDAFILSVDSTLVPRWSSRIGAAGTAADTTTTVAFTSAGEVLAGGAYFGATTGAAVFPYTAGHAGEAFLLKFSATGAVQFAAPYGGAGSQGMNAILVNRLGVGAALDALAFGGPYDTTIVFPPLAGLPATAGAAYVAWAPLGP
jgi:hypothetical protein